MDTVRARARLVTFISCGTRISKQCTIFSEQFVIVGRVVAGWYGLYTLHFGEARTLSEAEFSRIFEPAIFRNKSDLLEKNRERYAEDVRSLGRQLAERGVPLREIIASLQLFEQAAQSVFPIDLPNLIDIYTKFDQLSHIRIFLLVDAYFRVLTANTGARIRDLEREAARLPYDERSRIRGIVGASPGMCALYRRIEAVGKTCGTVLIVGESGTGKELVARAIHEMRQGDADTVHRPQLRRAPQGPDRKRTVRLQARRIQRSGRPIIPVCFAPRRAGLFFWTKLPR